LQLLADENVHPLIVRQLRTAGHSVEWVKESSRGADDGDILSRADIGELVLVTLDRDFGDLIFRQGFPTPRAILYSRLSRANPQAIADRVLAVIERGIAEHHMITITAKGERLKAFPGVHDGRH
jgi:predicted nuclease of predicted toxin-antitoxin system